MIRSDLYIHHGNNIKRIRELLGHKQEFLAIELDITQQSVSEMERKEFVNLKTLRKIANIFQVPVKAIETLNNKKIADFKNEFIEKLTMNEQKVSEGKVIKFFREYLNVSIKEIALKLNVSEQEVLDLESKMILDKETLLKVVEALNIPVEAITELEQDTSVNIFSGTFTDFKDNAAIFNSYPTFNPIDKIVELYDKLLETEKEKVRLLEEVLKGRG